MFAPQGDVAKSTFAPQHFEDPVKTQRLLPLCRLEA